MVDSDNSEKLSRSDKIALRISVIQTVLAVTGLFIGTIALYAALNEADAVRKQQQASVWPHLQAGRDYYAILGEERVEFVVRNRGIGPARVNNVSVRVDGDVKVDWFEVIKAVHEGPSIGISNHSILKSVIGAGEDITMFSLTQEYSDLETVRAVRNAFDEGRIVVDICYCSVFDTCWAFDSAETELEQAPVCPAQDKNTEF